MAGRMRTVLEMIKFEHSVFALPFALTGALLAARAKAHGWPTLRQVLWIVVAMVAARSAAMTLNRIADLRYDKENPRTKMRALATGALSVSFAWMFTVIAVGVFFVAAWQLNLLALELAPVAIAILFFYSYTKRFTHWSHLFLGFALGISPAAAWIAITGGLDWRMLILCGAVTLWVGGFDVLYACQDFEHDRAVGLRSLPESVGIPAAFWTARAMHVAMLGLLVWFGQLFHFRTVGWLGIAAVALLLGYEHAIVSPGNLRRLNAAFFTMNGVIALVFLCFVAADLWLRS